MSCPCESGAHFEQCCGPILDGAPAPTAEKLMRSRYSAYARGVIDHIAATHDPSVQQDFDRDMAERWSNEAEWLGLSIVDTEAGGPEDEEGVVEFIARYRAGERIMAHHERSRFRRIDGRWYFVDGQMIKPTPVRAAPTVGRNAPCPCGSGKKYKRCHGA